MQVYLRATLQGDSITFDADSIPAHVSYTSAKGMSVWGVGRDSLIADSATVTNLALPLRKDADECAFILNHKSLSDTLYLAYTRDTQFISLACGCAVFARLDTVYSTSNYIDSIDVLNTNITTAKENHIKIFFHNPSK